MGKVKTFTAVKQPMQSKELHKNRFTFCLPSPLRHKREKVTINELDCALNILYTKLKQNFKQPTGKVLQNADVKACLSEQHNKYVFVPADKAPNNIIIICKRYYIETLIKELGLDNSSTTTGNSTYTPC